MRKNIYGEEDLGLKPCGAGKFLLSFALIRCMHYKLHQLLGFANNLFVIKTLLAPNCFCSTDNIEDSPDTNIPPFKWPASKFSSREDAFQQLNEVLQAYEPGQNGIDGGGFAVVEFDPKKGYIYAQFESLKNGYVDDLELAIVGGDKDSNVVQVRSSSRLGYVSDLSLFVFFARNLMIFHQSITSLMILVFSIFKLDYGVNAKRINYLAKALREKGWDAEGVLLKTHKGYADENQVSW